MQTMLRCKDGDGLCDLTKNLREYTDWRKLSLVNRVPPADLGGQLHGANIIPVRATS
jgi:hypothetical protein